MENGTGVNPAELNASDATSAPVIFDLTIQDSDLVTMIGKPLRESQAYWEDTFGLKKVREANMNLWLPNHWKNKDVYDYQEEYLYQDPKVFISVETICSVVNSRIAQPDVMPGQDNVISRQVADDLQKVLYAHGEKYRVADIFRISTRNLLLKRIGYVKLRWDPARGEHGDVVPDHVAPEDVVVDQDARWGETPRFIAQKIKNKTGEELISMFPDARQGIYALLGVNRKNSKGDLVAYKSQLGIKKNIWEVWFRYYDEVTSRYAGGLAYVDENVQKVLGKMRNPNWNYEDETVSGAAKSNLLDFPQPPFFPANYLNDGSSYIDLTTMVEQSASLQGILDRRGFQIMENAEMAGSGLIFNTQMIKKEDIAKLSGSPDERIGVKGDVNKAVMRVAPPPLPSYVIEDKNDARQEIDNIFATHDITRGETGAKTLGQDQLQQGQDYTRMDDIARAVERQAALYNRYLVQMMKVYYTEEHWMWAAGEDGQFDHVMMKSDLIEDGIDVTVEANSTLPPNKKEQMKFATDLAPAGLIDPLSLYEVGAGGTLPSPKKMMERLVKWKTDPASFAADVESDDVDRKALMDIQVLLRGEQPEQRDEITPEYLKFFNHYVTTNGALLKAPDKIKVGFAKWGQEIMDTAKKQMEMMMSQMPSPEDMAATNQKALAQKQLEDQMGGGGQPPTPGGGGAPPPPDAGGGAPPGQPAPGGQPPAAPPMPGGAPQPMPPAPAPGAAGGGGGQVPPQILQALMQARAGGGQPAPAVPGR